MGAGLAARGGARVLAPPPQDRCFGGGTFARRGRTRGGRLCGGAGAGTVGVAAEGGAASAPLSPGCARSPHRAAAPAAPPSARRAAAGDRGDRDR